MLKALQGIRKLHSGTLRQAVSELTIPVPWGEIRGKVWGPENGCPVLCVHGWADNCGTFNNLIPLLPKECRYVAVDLPGHGLSSHRPPGVLYIFALYVMDLRRVVDALQWNRFSIIGHSMGGNVAGMFSSLYPDMVESVVLLDCFGFLPTDLRTMYQIMSKGYDETREYEKKALEKTKVYSYETSVERLKAANPFLTEQSAHILLERGLVQVEGGVVFSRDLRINMKNFMRFTLEQSLDLQSKIKASVLLIIAADGFVKLFEDQQKYVSSLLQGYLDKNNTVVNVPGDHHIHLNNAEAIAPLVSDFLRTKLQLQSDSLTNMDTSKL